MPEAGTIHMVFSLLVPTGHVSREIAGLDFVEIVTLMEKYYEIKSLLHIPHLLILDLTLLNHGGYVVHLRNLNLNLWVHVFVI